MSAVEHGGLHDEELRALGLEPGAVLDLSANLHPDGPPPAVVEAIRAALPRIARYPSVDAAPLREAIARRHGVAPDGVLVTPGASAAIALVAAALLAPGERCTVFPPTFGEYARAIEAAGGVAAPCVAPAPAFEVALPEPAPLAFLCNPDNPTGVHLDRARVEAVAARCGVLVIDAAYEDFAERPWDATALVREGADVVVVHSLTKLFAMPGVRTGYVVAPPALASRLRRLQPPWPAGALEIAAGLAALDGIEERRRSVPALHARRRRIEAAFAARGRAVAPSSTHFALVEAGDARAFRAAMLRRGFAVRDATSFGLPAWVRIAAPPERDLPRLLEAIEATLA